MNETEALNFFIELLKNNLSSVEAIKNTTVYENVLNSFHSHPSLETDLEDVTYYLYNAINRLAQYIEETQ